jgi:hypothetical protein
MTPREQRRAWVLTRVLKHERTMSEAAEALGLSERQLWRLRAAFERDGPAGLVHGNRGRPSERRLDAALRDRVVELRRTEKPFATSSSRLAALPPTLPRSDARMPPRGRTIGASVIRPCYVAGPVESDNTAIGGSRPRCETRPRFAGRS